MGSILDTGLKHTLKEEFCIYFRDTSGKRRYVYYIGSSVNTTEDIDDAMKLKSLEAAKGLLTVSSEMMQDKDFKVCHIATVVEDVDINSEMEE